ncbi:MAG: 50S ribosome-binding GTPase, partial [Mogibacterium sp.]|nr:50S ribosome-binding GTPase [Mogibacterium sp.]
MNALLGEGRVIVTDVPGTTRDTVEEIANIDGVPMTLIDTAGIRETDDVVEKLGIERTRDALVKADMAVVVLDGSCELDEEDEAVLDLLARGVGGTGAGVGGTGASIGMPSDRIIVVLNKKDQGSILAEKQIAEKLPKAKILRTSLVGLGVLEGAALVSDAISETYNIKGAVNRERTIVTSERHIAALESAADNLEQAIYLLEEGEALEITELNVHYAYDELGSITGETASDEILDTVFSKFCLGK